jgi:hypothetical protein
VGVGGPGQGASAIEVIGRGQEKWGVGKRGWGRGVVDWKEEGNDGRG